jgi:hypothetical protein
LTKRNKWIRERYKKLRNENPEVYNSEIYLKIMDEVDEKFPLLWIDFETIRHICRGYGYYKEKI